jgi:phosphomevalonate kinase
MVLLGEYSVLCGHPALVTAVNRRARVELTAARGADWEVAAPGFVDRPVRFAIDEDGGFCWTSASAEAGRALVLLERTVVSLLRSGEIDPARLPPASAVLDTGEFFQSSPEAGPVKLGLGSSAALTVALTEALLRWTGRRGAAETKLGRLNRLVVHHRAFQGGRGSGIDLAASLLGGVVEYCLDERRVVRLAAPFELPAGLFMIFIWTGRSASTSAFLERLELQLEAGVAGVVEALADLGDNARHGIESLRSGDVPAALTAIDHFDSAMEFLGVAADLQILSDEHLELRRLAHRADVRYKPSGAGGGDVGVGFSDDPSAVHELADRAEASGFTVLDLDIDPDGCDTS